MTLSAEERAWLAERGGRLTYCFSPVWRPFDYLDEGTHRGLFRDYLDLFGRKLGIRFDPLTSRDWPEALRFAQERRCDLISGAVRNAERERYLSFTAPFVTLTHVLLAQDQAPFVPNLGLLAGKPIGVPGHSAVKSWLQGRHPGLTLVDFDNIDQTRVPIPRKLDTHSSASWTPVPRQPGQSERSDARGGCCLRWGGFLRQSGLDFS